MHKEIRVLIIEDNPGDVRLIKEILKDSGETTFIIAAAIRLTEGMEYLSREAIDVVLLDLSLPDSHGMETFLTFNASFPTMPILLLTGLDDSAMAIEAINRGAQDYLVKGKIDKELIVRSIHYAIERKNNETKIAHERNQLGVTLSTITDGVVTTDAQGKITLINKSAQNIIGLAPQDAINKNLKDIFPILDQQTNTPCGDPVQTVLQTQKVFFLPTNTVFIDKNGSEKFIEGEAAPINEAGHKTTGVVVVFRDTSEQHKARQEIIKMQKLEALGILAGGIAHDFNNILTGILNNVSYAKLQAKEQSAIIDTLLDIEKITLKSKDLTHQLLTFAKGGLPVKETISLPELIRNQTTFSLRGTNYTYTISADKNVWPVDLDVGQFNQVITNIITNAKEAMPEGGKIEITINNLGSNQENKNLLPEKKYIRIAIKDFGVGIPERHINKIFDPYFTTKQQGSGLGLAVTYSIIKRHHGDIRAESKPGNGTTFLIYLPVSENPNPTEPQKEPTVATGKGKILIMDDEPMILETVQKLLSVLGYSVVCAKNGQEALQSYRTAMSEGKPFLVVIMDLVVPGGMGGKESMAKILEIDPKARGIVSSAYSQDPVMADPQKYGFKAMVAKPYDISAFSQILAKVIQE